MSSRWQDEVVLGWDKLRVQAYPRWHTMWPAGLRGKPFRNSIALAEIRLDAFCVWREELKKGGKKGAF